MKFNWGTGIALVYLIFAGGMIGMVFASRKYDPGLVQNDYYNLDLNYQDRLDRKNNTAALPEQPKLVESGANKTVTIQLPAGMGDAQGNAKYYRSATVQDDFTLKFDNGQAPNISTEKLASGRWHVEMEWEAAGKKYFWESSFFVGV